MAVKKTYRINLRNYGSPPAVMVSQYDEGYAIAFEIFDGPLPVLASSLSGYTFKLKGRQPGNPPFLAYEFEGTLATALNAVVSFEIDTTMTGRAGKGTAELVILDEENDVKFASVNFAVYTEPAAVPDGSIDADVERAQEIADEVAEIVDGATEGAEAWAVGQRGGVDVESTDPTYHNNAKYYAESISGVTDQVATNTSDISDLKEDLNVANGGKYVFVDVVDGEKVNAATGVISNDSRYVRSSYIPLTDFISLTVKNKLSRKCYIAFYDDTDTFVNYATLNANSTHTVVPPTGAVKFLMWEMKNAGGLNGAFDVYGYARQVYEYTRKEINGKILPQQKTYSCVQGDNVEPLSIVVGHMYKIVNNSGDRISVSSCTESGSDIETFGSNMYDGVSKTFIATKTAEYIRIYLIATSGSVTVYDLDNIGNIVDDVRTDVTTLQGIVHAKEPRPESGYEDFSVSFNCHDYTTNSDDGKTMYTDYGVIALPTNYSPSSVPSKLVILCGGNAERITSNTNPLSFNGWSYYLAKGYAVMDMNGMSPAWANAEGFPVTNRHFGNKYLIESYKKGFEYVVSKYNIDSSQVFIAGISMGGGAAALLVQSGIFHVVANCLFCPALSVYKQAYMHPWLTDQAKTIAGQWGFDDWATAETFDQTYFLANIDKISGFDNLLIRTIGDFTTANAHYGDTAEADAYNAMKKFYPVPVKVWHCLNDNVVLPRYSQFFVNMIKNAGGQAWLRTFATGAHVGGWETGSVSDIDVDGETITTSIPFYESVLFFERFGG